MSLEEFDIAESMSGHLYELNRGIISVVDVPGMPHAAQVDALREQLSSFRRANPGAVKAVLSGAECKVLLRSIESERHPDLAVYKSTPQAPNDWAGWIPEIVVEVVSASSRHRDYEEKPEEYFLFGVREYWIVDRSEQKLVVYRRVGGQWAVRAVQPPEFYECGLLKGLQVDIGAVFAAANDFE
ncbi:MAG: hypothetical protein JWR85_3958 [Marmoricola sp.]|nr:hypothetical protein [Marmoricola sp.]